MLWFDPRFTYNEDSLDIPFLDFTHFKEQVWLPDWTFDNLYDLKLLSWSIYSYPNGLVHYEIAGTVELMCDYDFKWIPFDW
jgi:hypothetical protein